MKPAGDIVLITGSSGRIGTAVMRQLSKRFDNVVGFDRKAPIPAINQNRMIGNVHGDARTSRRDIGFRGAIKH